MSQIHKDNFDGFTIKIFQDEDGDWLAHFIELPNVSAFADTAHAALDELELAWIGVKESYRKHGEDIPTSEALLGSLLTEIPQNKPNQHEVLGYSSQKTLKTKRQSLFGSDKDKIVIGEKFNEP